MKNFLLFTVIFSFIYYPLIASLRKDSEKFIKENFSSSVEIKFIGKVNIEKDIKKKVEKKAKQKFFTDHFFLWKISNSTNTSYAVLDHVWGKVKPITYVVILDSFGKVKNSKVIKYREGYGGEVKSPLWLNQFNNKSNKSTFILGKDIDGISGATISVKSMIKGIERIVNLSPYLEKITLKYLYAKK